MSHYKVLTYREIMKVLDITYSATKQLAYRREKEGRWERERQNDPNAKIRFIIPNIELEQEKERLDKRSQRDKPSKSQAKYQNQSQDQLQSQEVHSLMTEIRGELKKEFSDRYDEKIGSLEADNQELKETKDNYERKVSRIYERLVAKEEEITTLKAQNVAKAKENEQLAKDLKLASRPFWKKILGLGKE